VSIAVPQHRGDPMMFFHDEAYRADASMETLGALRPIEAGEHSRGGRDSR
jgi:acetyl-CoA C-acetyltransferase